MQSKYENGDKNWTKTKLYVKKIEAKNSTSTVIYI